MAGATQSITIPREAIAGAAERLVGRVSDMTPTQIEAALWHWLEAATEALVEDGDRYAVRATGGFLTHAFDRALRQEALR